jgi:hypothetical protein
MNIHCEDRERILLEDTAEGWAALRAHAEGCAACSDELRAWEELSVATAALREEPENPALWRRIEASLAENAGRKSLLKRWRERISVWRPIPVMWQLGVAGTVVLALVLAGGYVSMRQHQATGVADNQFLKDRALLQVERTEREYMKAIDALAAEAKPQLEASASPLVASYQEKLMVLDSAIDELRVEAGQNPSNAHLRYQLLAMYRDKESTLREIVEMKR